MSLKTLFAAGLAACLITLAASGASTADEKVDDPARLAAARELVTTMGGPAQAQASIQQFVTALLAEITQHDEKLAKPAEVFMQLETRPDSPRFKQFVAEMDGTAAKFYAERFTTEELKAIVAFQTSEAGRKFLKLTPDLVALVGPRMTEFQEGLLRDMQKGFVGGASKEAPAEASKDAPPAAPAPEKK